MKEHFLDLRGVACPMNFVKTKLYMDKIPTGTVIEVLLDDGEPIESVSASISEEGHEIVQSKQQTEGYYCLLIRKSGA